MGPKIPFAWVALSAGALIFSGCQRPPQPLATPPTPALAPEPIYFLKGDGTLSPGAILKLKAWVDTWGVQGKWTLGCPTGPGLTYELLEKRLLAIRAELRKLGVVKVDTVLLPSTPAGQYDMIYVAKDPA
jgi:hypothetical protein